jgi:death-on-curing protein
MRLILQQNNLNIYADQDEKYDFVISSAKGEIKFNQIRDWLTNHVK